MSETTFHNVKITIEASSPAVAYEKLCEALATIANCEYSTDVFTVDDGEAEENTAALFPQDESLCTCLARSWYGPEHDTACQLKGVR